MKGQTYDEKWAHLFEGVNASRGERWRLVPWDGILPGDTVLFVDSGGRHGAMVVDNRQGPIVVTTASFYAGHMTAPAVRVALTARGACAVFQYAERARLVWSGPAKPRRFRPLTLGAT